MSVDIVKTDASGLVKNKNTGAIVNIDDKELTAYRIKRAKSQKEQEYHSKVDNVCDEVKLLRQKIDEDLAEIKKILLGNK